ncbi:MAG: DedA family protein [Bacteroidota bacterium]|nr:DedA family protein [Bacteroidota bacterium]
MPDEISGFIIKHGYLAICILIFIQEIGIPNPIPNEIVLLYAGYLSFAHLLSLPIVLILTISSDFFATAILFSIFYFFGKYIIEHKPRWFPISVTRIKRLEKKVSDKGKTFIFFGRMTPFIRGYVTVIAGLINIPPKIFFPITFFSTAAWCSICIISGFLLGPSWSIVAKNLKFNHVIIFIISVTAISIIIHSLIKKKSGNKD